MRRALLLLGALALALPPDGRAQTAGEVLERAINAYQDFQLDNAAALLRRALAFPPSSGLPRQDRARALSYLAAVELFRDRRDSALAAFQRLVLLAPRYRPSDRIFPPPVLNTYHEVRQATKVVDIAAPDTVDLPLSSGAFAPWAYASSLHDVTASVVRSDGRLVRPLYSGPIGDSLAIRWDGRDSTGVTVASGSYQLRVESRDANRQVIRIAQLPLDVQIVRRDTLPHPPRPDSLLKPERIPLGPALRVFATGAALGGLTAGLPALFGAKPYATGTRFVVGGALGLAGLAGFLSHHPGRRIPENISANGEVLGRWEREREAVVRENRLRIEDVRLKIRTGALAQMDRDVR